MADNEETFLDPIRDWDYSHLDLIGVAPPAVPPFETTSLLMKELDELKPSSTTVKTHLRGPKNAEGSGSTGGGGSWDSADGSAGAGSGIRYLDKQHSEPHNVARAILQAVKNRRSTSKSALSNSANFAAAGGHAQPRSTGSTPKKGSLFNLGRSSKTRNEEATFSEPESYSNPPRSNGHAVNAGPGASSSPQPTRSSGEFAKSRLAKRLQLDLNQHHNHLSERQQRFQRYSRDHGRQRDSLPRNSFSHLGAGPTSSHNGGFLLSDASGPDENIARRLPKESEAVIHHNHPHHSIEAVESSATSSNSVSGQAVAGRSSISPVEEVSGERAAASVSTFRSAPRAPAERSMDSGGELSPKPGPSGLNQSPRSRLLPKATPPPHVPDLAAHPVQAHAIVELAGSSGRRSWTSSTTGEEEHALLGGFRESPPKAASVGIPIDTIDSATSGDEEAVLEQSGGPGGRCERWNERRTATNQSERSTLRASRVQRREAPPGVALPACCATSSPTLDSFMEFRSRFATSYRLDGVQLRSPVDLCLLPDDCLAVADYDNGFLLLSPDGHLLRHYCPLPENKNACAPRHWNLNPETLDGASGILCTVVEGEFRLLVLVYKEGIWAINVYNWSFDLVEVIHCPHDAQIETWAMRKIALGETVGCAADFDDPGRGTPTSSPVTAIFLLATGESKTVIWARELGTPEAEWEMMISESGRRGPYNDFDVRLDGATGELQFLLVDWKKAQLSTVLLNSALQLVDTHTVRIRRVKGQEWVVQGPKLAAWDESKDVLLYDGSGKLFLFDGESFKCRKIVADLGKGEVSALVVRDGWVYVLCRYRLALEAFRYKDMSETNI